MMKKRETQMDQMDINFAKKQIKKFFCRQQDGGSVITWGVLGFNRQSFLAFCNKQMNFQDYQQILKDHFIPIQDYLGGPNCVF